MAALSPERNDDRNTVFSPFQRPLEREEAMSSDQDCFRNSIPRNYIIGTEVHALHSLPAAGCQRKKGFWGEMGQQEHRALSQEESMTWGRGQ